jgi:hypothetical protein
MSHHSSAVTRFAVFLLFSTILSAGETPDTGPRLPGPFPMRQWTPPPPPEALEPVPVLRETEYVIPSEGRPVIVQEITPPAQPQPPPAPPVPVLSEEERAARLERWKAAAAKRPKYKVHMFSCTVYDGKHTQVRWSHQDQAYTAWSGPGSEELTEEFDRVGTFFHSSRMMSFLSGEMLQRKAFLEKMGNLGFRAKPPKSFM